MSDIISEQDRQEIYDTLTRYVWCMDTGDIDGVVGTFTADGVVKDYRGTMWDASKEGALGFAKNYIRPAGRRGGQHWVQFNLFEDAGQGAFRVTSYWYSPTPQAEGAPKITSEGRYIDTLVKVDGRWLMREKLIDPWNSDTVSAAGIKPTIA